MDRNLAARDRAAAAADRQCAAVDRQRAAEYLRRTYRDQLTSAVQREPGRDLLRHEVDRAHRLNDHLVVAFLDVVGMKRINDEYGHRAGDDLLRALGSALLAGLRSYDVVVRYGGDEFVCALPKATLAVAGPRFAEVLERLSAVCPGTSLSMGLVELGDDESLDEVIDRADREMYESRRVARALARPGADESRD